MVHDADASPFHPDRPVVQIVIDGVVHPVPMFVGDPAAIGARRVEIREVGDEERAARGEHASHLWDSDVDVWDVDERKIADDKVEGAIGEGQRLGDAPEVVPPSIAMACGGDKRLRGYPVP